MWSERGWTDLHRLGETVSLAVGMAPPRHVPQGRGPGETGVHCGRLVIVRGHWRAGVSEGVTTSLSSFLLFTLQLLVHVYM